MNESQKQQIQEMKVEFSKRTGQAILVFVSHGFQPKRLRYLFTNWDNFEKHLPFSNIDAMYSVDFEIWDDGDSI